MADSDRLKRLRAAVVAMPPPILREAIAHIDEEAVRVLPAPARPLANQLRRSTDPAAFLRRLPNPLILALLADVVSDECLDRTRELLGDAADDPTAEQLHAALETVVEDFDVAVVRVMLATVARADAEASALCDELLITDERFALPDDAGSAPAASRPRKAGPSEEVLARRRARKEEERAKKARQRERAAQPKRTKQPPPPPPPAEEPPAPVAPVARRAPTGVPAGFDAGDPLIGAVVIADIPFEGEHGGKTRPAVVVATSPDQLLVRPGYSEGGLTSRRWQSHEVRDLAAAGVVKQTWIEHDARVIPRASASEPVGRLADDDWNALW